MRLNPLVYFLKKYKNDQNPYILNSNNRIAMHENLTIDIILDNQDMYWKYSHIILNTNIPIKDILDHLELPWVFDSISKRKMTIKEFEYINEINRTRNLNIRWDYSILIQNPHFIDYIFDHSELPWDYIKLSFNTAVTIGIILNHPEIPWDFCSLSQYAKLSLQDVIDHPEFPWDHLYLSINKNIRMSDIIDDLLNGQQISWDYHAITLRNDVDIDHILVLNHFLVSYRVSHFKRLSICAKITIKDVISNSNLPWNYRYLSMNSNIKFKDIQEYPELLWDEFKLSANITLTLNDIINNPEIAWNHECLILNHMNYKKHLYAYKIQKWWKQNKWKTKRNQAAWDIQIWWYSVYGFKKQEREGHKLVNLINQMNEINDINKREEIRKLIDEIIHF